MSKAETIKIGTRGSKLALWQAHDVAEKLQKAGFLTEIVIISTKGDQILDRSLSKIGSKGIFTEELETALRNGEIHLAQHSAKDLQSELAEDLEIIAFMERERENDVLISFDPAFSLEIKSKRVGTSSVRRTAFFKKHYPEIEVVDMRGNLQTRLEKLKNGQADALALAYAGVHRMGYAHLIIHHFSNSQFVPPVGQGSVAIETSTALAPDLRDTIRKVLNHAETETCLVTERAFLKALKGGCSIPAFCYAQLEKEEIRVTGGIISLDGKSEISLVHRGEKRNPEQLGQALANEVLAAGGNGILVSIRQQQAL
jgi:hydroxymethylbilane synthase